MKKISIRILQTAILAFVTITMAQSDSVSEDIILMNDSIQLPGTLRYNKTLKQQPLAIFIHGSGNVDRNGNQGQASQANYIKLLSDSLNKNGIAFYRYDKRTSNMANMKFLMLGISFDDFVKDAKIAIDNFKNDKRFSSISLIGHSQGSLVGMLASTAGVDSYISLAGPSDAIDKKMTEQIRKQNGDSIAGLVEAHFKELKATNKIEKVDPNLMALFNPQNQPFFTSWIKYNPIEEISKLTGIQILILNGTKDMQVFESDAEALHKANPEAQFKLIKNMNHVLKTITKEEDNLKSYTTADFPLSSELVTVISEFIKK
jgi:pimeloyl-ACP methyl ester carboxylesterase